MVKPQKYQATVSQKIQLTKVVYWLTFNLINPLKIEFTPGQRCLYNVSTKFNNYSICSSPLIKNNIQICVDTSPNGIGSKWIRETKIGDTIEFMGPLGNFKLSGNTETKKIFLATGTGLSPIRSMILSLLEGNYGKDIYMFFGVRSEEDIFWKKEFEELTKTHPNFHYTVCLSRASELWNGKKGYVQENMLQDFFPNYQQNSPSRSVRRNVGPTMEGVAKEFYLCGNGAMIKSAVELLKSKEIKEDQIFTEKFFDKAIA